MRTLPLAALMALAVEARAQEREPTQGGGSPAPAVADSAARSPAATEARPGDEGVFLLRRGATLAGRLVTRGSDGDVIELRSGERLRLPAGSVVGRLGPIGKEPAPEPAPGPEQVRVFLRDGRSVDGELVERDPDRVRIRTPDGKTVEFQAADVREVFHLAELRADRGGPVDPARGHYLFVPSAWGLAGGEYQVAFTAAEVPSLALGVTDWLTVSAGLVAPLLYESPVSNPSVSASLTASVEALPWLRAAGGFRGIAGPFGQTLFLFGTITAGTPTAHVSLYAGPPMPDAGRFGRFDETIAAVAGTARVTGWSSILFESWVTPRRDQPEAFVGLAARAFVGDHLAIDAGGFATTASQWGPWVALTWTGRWRAR